MSTATIDAAAAAAPRRPRRERLARYPIAHSFNASRPPEECYLRGVFVTGWRGKVCAHLRENIAKLRTHGVGLTPIGAESALMYLQGLVAYSIGRRRKGGGWSLMVGRDQDDHRRRPEGITDFEWSTVTRMNFYRSGDARADLVRAGYLIARQPREWNDDEDRYQGQANQVEIARKLFDDLGFEWSIVEAELEVEDAARQAAKEAQAKHERQQRAIDQAAARERRGETPALIQIKRPLRQAGAEALDLPVDAEGRRVPHTAEEQRRYADIQLQLRQDPEWRDRPAELQRATALARWRDELEPPN